MRRHVKTTDNAGFTCVCGSKSWYLSHVTWIERFLYWSGFYRDADMSDVGVMEMPLAGHPDKMRAALEKTEVGSDDKVCGIGLG